MSREIKKLKSEDFEKNFGEPLSEPVRKKIESYNMFYSDATLEERDYCMRRSVDFLLDKNVVFSGEHRIEQWENGWKENLDKLAVTSSEEAIIPKYFGKYPFVRFQQKFLKVESQNLEYNMLGVILDWLFDKYLKTASNIYEFGCGTGHNLLRAREFNKNATLWGMDWATSSQEILKNFKSKGIDQNINGHRFDYFNPDYNFRLEKDAFVYTVASLEQVGERYQSFVKYLIEQKPKLVVHIEPIGELLDKDLLIDYLSIEYFKKRNYLNGYLEYLKKLESEGVITIDVAKRSYIGSFFIDGYSIIVWSPR